MSAKKSLRLGRPAVYTGNVKRHIVSLVKKHGATGARAILNAKGRGKANVALIAQRSASLVPDAIGISMPTLLKFAKEGKVVLHRGRPKVAA